jgi:hypothetical protein
MLSAPIGAVLNARQPADLPTITLPLASTVLPDAGSKHKRKNGDSAKSLTWRRYLVAGIGFEPMSRPEPMHCVRAFGLVAGPEYTSPNRKSGARLNGSTVWRRWHCCALGMFAGC